MAKTISDEILKLKVVINGDEAQKRILDLELANKGLANTLDDLKKRQNELSRTRQKNSEEYKKNATEIQRLTAQMKSNNIEIANEIRSMDHMSLTMEQLRRRAADLSFQLSHMNPNSPQYAQTSTQLAQLNGRMTQLRTGATATGMSINNLANKFNQYQGIAMAGMAMLAGVAVSMQAVIDMNNKMADAQTAVEKTTGLSSEAVKQLTKDYSDFDTRTSRIDLLKISEIGGRLGIPKEQIKDFTREVDKAYVALGDAFSGGVEKVAESLGKIKNLFRETKDIDVATAMNQIGSALNELGAAGVASEENIAEFAIRVGSLPDALKPTIAETLALGAAFEESGVDAERSGTAYSNFVRMAGKEADKFAQVMGKSTEEVKKLINTNPMEFFLQFAEGAKGLETTELSQMLEYLKLNDQYIVSIVGAASENTDRFRKTIDLSNKSLQEATSLQEEFNKVNNNSAAIFEKVRRKFIGIFTSETVVKSLSWIIESFGKLIGAVEDTTGKVTVFRNVLVFLAKMIALITTAMFANNLLTGVYNTLLTTAKERVLGLTIVEKARNVVLTAKNILQTTVRLGLLLLSAAYNFLTGNTVRATASMRLFSATLAANPIGAVIALITALGTALYFYKQKQDEAKASAKAHAEEMQRSANIQKETLEAGRRASQEFKDSVDILTRTLKSNIATQEQRKKAYDALIKMHPEFIGTVDNEYKATAKLTEVYNELAFKIDLVARAKARAAAKQEIYDRIEKNRIEVVKNEANVEKEQKERNELRKKYNYNKDRGNSAVKMFGKFTEHNKSVALINAINADTKLVQDVITRDNKKVDELIIALKTAKGKQKKALQTELDTYLNSTAVDEEKKSTYTLPGDADKNKNKKEKKHRNSTKPKENEEEKAFREAKKKILDEAEKFNDRMNELNYQNAMDEANMMKDKFDKERTIIRIELGKRLLDLEKQKHSEEEFSKLDDIINKTKGKEKEKFQAIKEQWILENEQLTTVQTIEKEKSAIQLKTVDEKEKADELDKQDAHFRKMIAQLQQQEMQKLTELDSVAKQRAFLQDKISAEELAQVTTMNEGRNYIQRYYQEQSLAEQEKYLQILVDQLQSLPPADLTKEQVEALEAMRQKLVEIGLAKSDITADKNKNKVIGNRLASFGGNTDLLGLNNDQWQAMFLNTETVAQKIQKIGAAITIVKEAFGKYFAYMQANEARQLQEYEKAYDKRKKTLQFQLDTGVISQEEYKKQSLQIDAELDKKKAEIEYNQAKRQRAIQIADAITSTAVAVASALTMKPWTPANFVLAGITGAMGALQVATIMSQPLPEAPGAEDGLYPVKRTQDGKIFNAKKQKSMSGVYNQPTLLVGEGGAMMPELVVSGKAMRRIDPEIKKVFMQQVYQAEGFEKGLYPRPENSSSSSNDELMIKLMRVLDRNTEVLNNIEKNGVEAFIRKNAQNGKELKETQEIFNKLYNKNRH